jgi:hypothetical protein
MDNDDLEIKETCSEENNGKCSMKKKDEGFKNSDNDNNDNDNDNDKEDNQFWGENPNILFAQSQITEFFPVDTMTFSRKLNAITRFLILVSIVTYFFLKDVTVFWVSLVLVGFIYGLWKYKHMESQKRKIDTENAEGFKNPADKIIKDQLDANPKLSTQVFQSPTAGNPLGNVLITDIADVPNRKPAPPSYNENVNKDILDKTKQMIQNSNPDFPDISERLFGSIGDQFAHEQSMRQFYTMPSTTIPNDQQAFAEFCYGGMISCKEGNQFACARNLQRYNNY